MESKRTTAPNHAELTGKSVVGLFGDGTRRVPGTINDTTITDRGTVCVSISVDLSHDLDCDGVWTSNFVLA